MATPEDRGIYNTPEWQACNAECDRLLKENETLRAERDAMAEVVKAAREYAEQNELRRDIGRQGRASLGDTTERPVPPDYSRLLAALTALDTPEEETR